MLIRLIIESPNHSITQSLNHRIAESRNHQSPLSTIRHLRLQFLWELRNKFFIQRIVWHIFSDGLQQCLTLIFILDGFGPGAARSFAQP